VDVGTLLNHINLVLILGCLFCCVFCFSFDLAGSFGSKSEENQQVASFVGTRSRNMETTKYDIEKFSGENDFRLWRIKMEAILIQHGYAEALKGEERMSESLSSKEKSEMIDRARSEIMLRHGDKALREVARERTAASMWLKLESLYMTKSLANRLCLKQQLYTFKMTESRTVTEQLADFNKILDDLENIEVKLEDEDKALLLLNSLPKSFEHFKNEILYGKDQDITLEEVQTSIRTKEMQKQQDSKSEDNGQSLNISRGRSEKKGTRGKKSRSRSRDSKNGHKTKLKCFNCHKTGHFKKDCPNRIKKGSMDSADIVEASEGYESVGVLVASNTKTQIEWILDAHITATRERIILKPSN